ncbi:MAG: heme-dependent oxidative N-demethylase subunit alpha family protein [Rubrivivax sp.]
MSFDFDTAVQAPFRMQPGLRRLAGGAHHLTPLAAGSAHQREKLAVLSAFHAQALCVQPGFDPGPALARLSAHAAAEQPDHWQFAGARAEAPGLGTAVQADGRIEQLASGAFGLGDEVSRCLLGLPPAWRLAGLLSLTFAEDLAIVDLVPGTVPWMAVTLPSHWAPERRVGSSFEALHAPVADNGLLLKARDALLQLVSGPERWERFVWNVSDSPRLHAHPARVAAPRWQQTRVDHAWWRTERQTFLPLSDLRQAVFTIRVEVQPLTAVLDAPGRRARLHAAIASMSAAVLAYRGLAPVQPALLQWLEGPA